MNKSNIFALIALYVVLSVGYVNAQLSHPVPQGFMDDEVSFTLEPAQVVDLGSDRKLFKFGDEKNHGPRVWTQKKTDYSTSPRAVKMFGGYPSVTGGKLKKLSYAEITIETDNNSATAQFLHYRTKYNDASYFKFTLEGSDTKSFYYNVEIFE